MAPQLATVRLVRRATADGLVELEDSVPLGKAIIVDLSSRKFVDFWNPETSEAGQREIVRRVDGSWYPVEFLSIDEGIGRA